MNKSFKTIIEDELKHFVLNATDAVEVECKERCKTAKEDCKKKIATKLFINGKLSIDEIAD